MSGLIIGYWAVCTVFVFILAIFDKYYVSKYKFDTNDNGIQDKLDYIKNKTGVGYIGIAFLYSITVAPFLVAWVILRLIYFALKYVAVDIFWRVAKKISKLWQK